MKFANVVVVGFVVLGTFGLVFACQTGSSVGFSSTNGGEMLVGACHSEYRSEIVCHVSKQSCSSIITDKPLPRGYSCGAQVPFSVQYASLAIGPGPTESVFGSANGPRDCPDYKVKVCVPMSKSTPWGVIYYCGPHPDPVTMRGETYQAASWPCIWNRNAKNSNKDGIFGFAVFFFACSFVACKRLHLFKKKF